MKHLLVELNNLPDEILLIILRKLCNVEVLYSISGVNNRLSTIAHDSIFTSHLSLMTCLSDDSIHALSHPILDRFCSQILHEIHHKIKWLDLESSSIERILLATNYHNLSGLGLYNIDAKRALSLFTAETVLTHAVKHKLSSLVIDFNETDEQTSINEVNILLFTQIFTMFTNLQYLSFGPFLLDHQRLSFVILPSTVISSILLELHVHLDNFSNCLYLLDGRFNQLRTFNVRIDFISSSSLTFNNEEKLPSLRYFSLHCDTSTSVYDELIVLLLHRMFNLEKLNLHVSVHRHQGFVDGNDLKKNIIDHMPRLNKFTFNICSYIYCPDQFNLITNEDIQRTFKDLTDNQIISCVDCFTESKYSQCHIYSYPYSYRLKYYNNITNHFPGGLFEYVREISLFDERSFEHEFFLEIAQSFPLLEKLTIINKKPQNDKQRGKGQYYNKNLLIIEYPHLIELNLRQTHDDYVEQFLLNTKMCLPNDISLFVNYKSLKRVTHNFKRNATRMNCKKLRYLYAEEGVQFPKHFKDYFPHIITDVY